MIYAGIGSRDCPPAVLARITALAAGLRDEGWTLATGGAKGVDQAFMDGAGPNASQVMLPWAGYNDLEGQVCEHSPNLTRWLEMAKAHHPAWDRCRRGARLLHARNVAILEASSVVLAWSPDGGKRGGTGMGVRLAEAMGLPCCLIKGLTAREVMAFMAERASEPEEGPTP